MPSYQPQLTGNSRISTTEQVHQAVSESVRLTLFGLVLSAVLAVTKIVTGIVGSSFALIADGLESTFDLFSGLMVWGGLRISSSPPTEEFPYGRGKAEQLAALAVSTMLLTGAFGIALGAVRGITVPHQAPAWYTLPVLVGVVLAKEATYRILARKGRSVGSRALQSDAWHHRSDALTSLAAFVGISIALAGGEGYESADDWAALAACGVIVWNAGRLFRSAAHDILDAAAPEPILLRVRELALSVEGVEGIDDIRIRRSGLAYWVDIHVEVDGGIPVHEGHEIAHRVRDRLEDSELPVLSALVHIEPVPRAHDESERSTERS